MRTNEIQAHTSCTPEEIDEAAVWIARMHAPDRSRKLEKGLRRWLAEKPSHAAAFESLSDIWELSGALQRKPFRKLSRWQRAGFRFGFFSATAAVTAAAIFIAVGALFYFDAGGVATGVGEQRVLTLEDGTRISLNTATRVVVDYNERDRRVHLKSGEALFEVAKRKDRPFIVTVGNRQVRALGTSFVVRRDSERLAVTLVEGKIAVAPMGSGSEEDDMNSIAETSLSSESPALAAGASAQAINARSNDEILLAPGERLTISAGAAARIDRPAVEKVTAWRYGQIDLEDVSLAEAIEELNRYSALKLVLNEPKAATLRINGVFRAGDILGFAAAIEQSYGVHVKRRPRELILTLPQQMH